MCLIVFAHRVHPRYPLILLANRDEFYARPSAPLSWWPEAPDLLAGRDLKGGGTWLCLNRRGRLAAVTNVREGQSTRAAGSRSRGELPLDFVRSPLSARQYQAPSQGARAYEGFNLITFDGEEAGYLSNRYPSALPLAPGVHGLSNGALNAPWPKTQRLRQRLEDWLAQASGEPDEAQLLGWLADPRQPPDAELPSTGVPLEWERLLSSCFIRGDDYGTRASTLVLWRDDGHVWVREQSFGPAGPSVSRSASFSF